MEVRHSCKEVSSDALTLRTHLRRVFTLVICIGIVFNVLAISGIIWRRNILQRYWTSVMWFTYNIVQAGTLIRFISKGTVFLTFFYKFSVFGQVTAITLIVLYTTQLATKKQSNVNVWYKPGCKMMNAFLLQNHKTKIALCAIILNIISSTFIPILPLFALVSSISLLSFIILASCIYVLRRKSEIARMHLNIKVSGYYSITFVLFLTVNAMRLVIAYSWDYVRSECPSIAVHGIAKYLIAVNMLHLILDPLVFMLCHQKLSYCKIIHCIYFWFYGACFESEQDPRHWSRRNEPRQDSVFYIHGRNDTHEEYGRSPSL